MKQIENIIIADEGKVFRRIIDKSIYGKQITLGYTYYIGGNLLTEPHQDTAEDFEEIDEQEEYEPTIDILTDLEIAQRDKILEIYKYDSSSSVNEFYLEDGASYWIDKSTRVGLVNSTNMEIKLGRSKTTLILGDVIITYPCQDILNMLALLEVYAKDCYNTTASHIIAIKNCISVEEVKSYDYTVGYPDKLTFPLPKE